MNGMSISHNIFNTSDNLTIQQPFPAYCTANEPEKEEKITGKITKIEYHAHKKPNATVPIIEELSLSLPVAGFLSRMADRDSSVVS
jgi:hypothetical protein